MPINSKSNLPVFVRRRAQAMPRDNKTHMFYLVTIVMVLSSVLIATNI